MDITKKQFDTLYEQPIYEYTLSSATDLSISVINYGCIITKIMMPDKHGNRENIVLGFEQVKGYQEAPYFGAVIGRVAGRIKGSEFQLNGTNYQLASNEGEHHLHGGVKGFDQAIWHVEEKKSEQGVALELTYTSVDGEEGYPGNVTIKITYSLTSDDVFSISYQATSDQDTLLNLTNHSYFNLSGEAKETVLKHQLTMPSEHFLKLDEHLLPTGEYHSVVQTPFDFRKGRLILDGVHSEHPQNQLVGFGYDHPFILNEGQDSPIQLLDESSGRLMEVTTTEPCVVLYTGNHISSTLQIGDRTAEKYIGLCLETQKHPDAIHHPTFPSVVLKKGELYESKTIYTFSVHR
ncbi:aldose epimerase family protein [Alkalihalobacillus pseudalcaliphilus]|uniref:aldose epimerase family protein n=1 Tax=Alkalihalobacillus pseudalcaliphilus TaxID=79884 RepID=UPI00064E1451|nr:aldose epimerase family protein [Alkalihalobacillus pseudalcaliphilus]KMK76598.1 aldose epimerase [Alkalihalobacillus pseudalcaliphilus]